jgi:hypothetical protein
LFYEDSKYRKRETTRNTIKLLEGASEKDDAPSNSQESVVEAPPAASYGRQIENKKTKAARAATSLDSASID